MVKKVQKYQLGETLGSGTFSKVKYAVDTTTGKAYAMKIISRAMIAEQNMETQLRREIAIMKNLKHRNVVQLREVLQSDANIYIILELITGGELFDRIVKARKFNEAQARFYFQQLMTGLLYCHSQSIAHRDLKPENLLLDKDDVLKISDFGLSNLSSTAEGSAKMLQTTCGTPNYVAPEVLKERGYNGFAADIWSCGVILYVMLDGHLPFDAPHLPDLFAKIESGKYISPGHFSPDAKSLISRMLVVNPKERATVQEVMNHPWFKVGYKAEKQDSIKVQVSDEMVKSAVVETKDDYKKGSSSSADQPQAPKEMDTINAFDLATKLFMGAVSPLMSTAVQIRRETRFMAKGSSVAVVQSLMNVLAKMKANPKSKDKEIKGDTHVNNNLVSFTINVSPTNAGFCLVEMKRRKAETLSYNKFFRDLQEALQKEGVILSQQQS